MKKILLCVFILLTNCSFTFAQGCDSDTQFLCHFDCTDGDSDALDENCDSSGAHSITWEGTSQCDSGNTKFDNTLLLDGDSDYLVLSDSDDFDMWSSTSSIWTVDFWMKMDATNVHYFIFCQQEDSTNQWRMAYDGPSNRLELQTKVSDSWDVLARAGQISDTNWHHVAIIKDGSAVGVYLDGTQVSYDTHTATRNYAADLWIGHDQIDEVIWFDGNLDEIRFQNSDYFDASPNSTPDDSIDEPTEAYSVESSRNRMIVMRKKFIKLPSGGYRREISTQNFSWEGLI